MSSSAPQGSGSHGSASAAPSAAPKFRIVQAEQNVGNDASSADAAVSDEEGPALDERHSRSKSRTGSRAFSASAPKAAVSMLLKPGDMAAPPAPPPEAMTSENTASGPAAVHETSEKTAEQEASAVHNSEASSATEPVPPKDEEQNEKPGDEALTAFQYPDGRVKIDHPGIGERMRTYYPHEIQRIERKNDLLKTNAEKAIEGEAQLRPDEGGKIILTERAGYLATGYSFPWWKKWMTLFFTGLIQVSMNYNTSCYSNAVPGITEKFHVSSQAARVGQMIYLVAYSFGCELWAPWSEEFGRKPILQLSLTLVNGM